MEKKAEKERMLILRAGKCSNAFSYIELIVVLFIISIIIATVLPAFINLSESKIKSDAKQVASIIRYLSDNSLLRKETFFIKFDLDKNIIYWTSGSEQKIKHIDSLLMVNTQTKGDVTKGELIFFFEPDGAKENLEVYLMDKRDKILVSYNHLSRRVRVKGEKDFRS